MSNPHQPEDVTAYNESSLQALVRAIERSSRCAIALSQGEFSLILARCNYSALRERMVQRLRQLCPVKIRELVLPESVKTLYTTIQAELGDEQPLALMVFGLESVNDLNTVLTSTNQVREEFRKNFPFPLVLWSNDEVLRHLIRLAPDFESWATTTDFQLATDELIDFLRQTTNEVFEQVLATGAGRFLDNAAINLAIGSRRRSELESARKDLNSSGVRLESKLEASLEFVRGQDANDLEIARQHYERSLTFWQQSDDLERRGCLLYYLGLWWRRHAVLYRAKYQEACVRARDYFQQCVEVFQQAHRRDLVARFINALGEVLQQLKQWEDLETVAKAALELHHTYPDPIRLAYDYGLLAEVALAKFDWGEAKRYAEAALQTNAQALDSAHESQHLNTDFSWAQLHYWNLYGLLLAQAQHHLGHVQEAIQSLKTTKAECNHQYEPQIYIRILEVLRSIYFEQGEYLKAFEIKQERRSIEYQYGFQAFAGASHLQSKRQLINPALAQTGHQAIVAQEIAASGRQQDVNHLIQRISRNDHKLTIIHGQSGVGKSSIVKAGLVPALKQRAIGERDTLPIVLRVYTNWIEELARALIEELEEVSEKLRIYSDLVEAFKNSSVKAHQEIKDVSSPATLVSIKAILRQLQKNAERNLLTVLVFDQFEEFFFICTDLVEREQFYEVFKVCLNLPFVKVILCLREDYLHYLLECERLTSLDVINNNILDKNIRYYLGNFSPEVAKAVILELTERSQFYLEPALIDELVRDLAGNFGEVRPIELQVVGAQLQTDNITTLEKYHQLGPKEKLVERSLEEVIKDCGSENERAALLVLYLLTDENGTRPLKTLSELVTDLEALDLASEIDKLDLVLEILVLSRLVLLVPESPANRYQLVHDYLITFIRQQQAPGLLAELAAAREKQKLTEEQLRQALREKEEALRQEQQERKRAEIAEIEALISLSQALFLSHDQLGALVASVKAGKQLQGTEVPSPIKLRAEDKIRQAVYQVQERNCFQGHTSWVTSVRFSPDGKMIASASADRTVQLWSRDGTLLKTLKGHRDVVSDVSFSPDGKMIASASADRTVQLWSRDGTLLKTLQGHTDQVFSVSFSPDGKMIASASADKTVQLWSRDGTLLKTLQGHTDQVFSVSFSPDGKMIASASADKTIKLWSIDVKRWSRNGTLLKTLHGHSSSVNSVSFSPDGKTIASASADSTIKLRSKNGTLHTTFEGHSSSVNGVSFSSDDKTIASASVDKTVKLWSIDGHLLRTFEGHSSSVNGVSFSSDGKTIASASKDKTVKLWSIDRPKLQTLELDELLVRGCDWLHDYLKTNPYVSESDRHLCDGIGTSVVGARASG